MKIDPHSLPPSEIQPDLQSELKSIQGENIPIAPVASNELTAAESLFEIRGHSPVEREQILGQLSVQAAEVALSSLFAVPVKFALDALAGTGEGKRALTAVGHALEQTYQAQEALFKGDVEGVVHAFEGGSSHKERESKFFAAVTDRIRQLQTKGGTLTAQDVAGFKQAIAYGDIHPLGTDVLDLSKLDLAVGTNPFGPTGVGNNTSAAFLSPGAPAIACIASMRFTICFVCRGKTQRTVLIF